MRLVLLITSLCIATPSLGQKNSSVIAEYRDTERMGNLITRWYYDIVGTSLIRKERLILYHDSTYQYTYQGGACGTFDEDRTDFWVVKGDTLILEADNELHNRQYIQANSKLYDVSTDIKNDPKNWAMR